MPSGRRQACIASAISAGGSFSAPSARASSAAARMPSRMAARSRGPARPTAMRASARARSGAAARRERVSARSRASSTKAPTASSRCAIAAGSVSGADKSLRKQPRAGGGHAAVDGVQQRAAPLAGQRAHQFEIAARGLVDRHGGAGALAQRRRQRRTLADLRALDVSHAGRRRGQLQPRQRAEGLAGGDREERGQPPLGGGGVEHVARQRRHRRQRTPERRELAVAVKRVGDDDLARLQPRDLGGER